MHRINVCVVDSNDALDRLHHPFTNGILSQTALPGASNASETRDRGLRKKDTCHVKSTHFTVFFNRGKEVA